MTRVSDFFTMNSFFFFEAGVTRVSDFFYYEFKSKIKQEDHSGPVSLPETLLPIIWALWPS